MCYRAHFSILPPYISGHRGPVHGQNRSGHVGSEVACQEQKGVGYVLRLSEAVAEELRRAKSKVTISVLCPGPVPTEFDQVADVRFSIPGMDSTSVARLAVAGTLRGQLLILPGVRMKAVHFFQRFVPDPVLARLCWRVQRRKSGLD